MNELLAKWAPMEIAGSVVFAYCAIRFAKVFFDGE